MTDAVELDEHLLSASERPLTLENRNIALGGSSIIAPGRDAVLNYFPGLLGARPIEPWALKDARQDFVPPQGYLAALSRLVDRHVLVIRGGRKIGRKTGALNLLGDVRTEMEKSGKALVGLMRLRTSWLEPDTSALHSAPQHAYLLDLSDSTDEVEEISRGDLRPDGQFGAALEEFAATLTKKSSFLVIVTTPEVWEKCTVSAQGLTVDWRSPSAVNVVAARLLGDPKSAARATWLEGEKFAHELSSATIAPSDAVRLAEAIARAEQIGKTPPEEIALDEFRRWERYLRSWFRDNQRVYDRVIFIAAAALRRAPAKEIIDAADDLLRAANEKESVLRPLRAPDLVERLSKTGAEIRGNQVVSLNDRRPGLDEAVMDWVWNQRPGLHEALLDWLVGLATKKDSTQVIRDRMAEVIAGLSLRRESGAGKLMLFARAQSEESEKHFQLAVRIIDDAVLDPAIGARIRNTLLAWSNGKDSVRLKLAAAVCGGSFGFERTDLALKRLSKVLVNEFATPGVVQAAGRALSGLASRDELRPAVLDAITKLLKETPITGARAFLELVRLGEGTVVPALLADVEHHPNVGDTLAEAWVSAHEAVGTDLCAPVMCSWIEAIGEGLAEPVVLTVCLPVLRRTAGTSLDARAVQAASPVVAERILAGLVKRKDDRARTTL